MIECQRSSPIRRMAPKRSMSYRHLPVAVSIQRPAQLERANAIRTLVEEEPKRRGANALRRTLSFRMPSIRGLNSNNNNTSKSVVRSAGNKAQQKAVPANAENETKSPVSRLAALSEQHHVDPAPSFEAKKAAPRSAVNNGQQVVRGVDSENEMKSPVSRLAALSGKHHADPSLPLEAKKEASNYAVYKEQDAFRGVDPDKETMMSPASRLAALLGQPNTDPSLSFEAKKAAYCSAINNGKQVIRGVDSENKTKMIPLSRLEALPGRVGPSLPLESTLPERKLNLPEKKRSSLELGKDPCAPPPPSLEREVSELSNFAPTGWESPPKQSKKKLGQQNSSVSLDCFLCVPPTSLEREDSDLINFAPAGSTFTQPPQPSRQPPVPLPSQRKQENSSGDFNDSILGAATPPDLLRDLSDLSSFEATGWE